MMKFEKKEYPVSMFKVFVHDSILDRLEWVREKLEARNNVEAFAICVNGIYNQLQALDEYHKTGQAPENEAILDIPSNEIVQELRSTDKREEDKE